MQSFGCFKFVDFKGHSVELSFDGEVPNKEWSRANLRQPDYGSTMFCCQASSKGPIRASNRVLLQFCARSLDGNSRRLDCLCCRYQAGKMRRCSSRCGCPTAAWPSSATGTLAGGICGERPPLAQSSPSCRRMLSLATHPGSLATIPTSNSPMAGTLQVQNGS